MATSLPGRWGATVEEAAQPLPCDGLIGPPRDEMIRAVDVEAPVAVTFRWLCQLKVAPYSYDLIDNLGRRSPRTPTPGAENLAVGQRFLLIFDIAAFEQDVHITGIGRAGTGRLFGPMAVTYLVVPVGADRSRLIAKLVVPAGTGWRRAGRLALQWGDLVMMRRQLLTLKALAGAQPAA
jgi:hypothetical protein